MIRRIGIDFGTSTTVLRVKNYGDDGKTPASSDRLGCIPVKFGGDTTTPSMARRLKTGESVWGHEAVKDQKDSQVFLNFKMDLLSSDAGLVQQTREHIQGFFQYLYQIYKEQDEFNAFGDKAQSTETWISYPVKWPDKTVEFMLEAAGNAGFPNLHCMNEANAAVIAAILQNQDKLKSLGLKKEGDKLRILLADMGAGTADLVLGEYIHHPLQPEWQLIQSWPKGSGAITCGGREFDARLKALIRRELERDLSQLGLPAENFIKVLDSPKTALSIKAWKEQDVSPMLQENKPVETCVVLDNCIGGFGDAEFTPLTRSKLEALLEKPMGDLIALVNECLYSVPPEDREVQAVVLVGGNCQWYFVPELFCGKSVNGQSIQIPLLQKEPARILSLPLPQETVAAGLALGGLSIELEAEPPEPTHPTPPEAPASGGTLSYEGLQRIAGLVREMSLEPKLAKCSFFQAIGPMESCLDDTPRSLYYRIKKANGLRRDLAVYFVADTSILGNCRRGCLLCNLGLLYFASGRPRSLVTWQMMHTQTVKMKDSYLTVDGANLFHINMSFGEVPKAFERHVNEILSEAASLPLTGPAPGKPPAARQSGQTSAPVEKTQRAVQQAVLDLGWLPDKGCRIIQQAGQALSLEQEPLLRNFLKKYAGASAMDYEYYFFHDDSFLNNGKGEGFAISSYGLHMKAILTKYIQLPWRETHRLTLSVKDGGLHVVLDNKFLLTAGLWCNSSFPKEDCPRRAEQLISLIRQISAFTQEDRNGKEHI